MSNTGTGDFQTRHLAQFVVRLLQENARNVDHRKATFAKGLWSSYSIPLTLFAFLLDHNE